MIEAFECVKEANNREVSSATMPWASHVNFSLPVGRVGYLCQFCNPRFDLASARRCSGHKCRGNISYLWSFVRPLTDQLSFIERSFYKFEARVRNKLYRDKNRDRP